MLQQHMPEQCNCDFRSFSHIYIAPSYLLGIALPYIFQSDLLLPALTSDMQETLIEDLPEGLKNYHEVTVRNFTFLGIANF